ncbi:MAG: A24 family peptidase [Myxococcota bacterium]
MFELSFYQALAVVVGGIAFGSDVRSGTIPNWLTLPILAVVPLLRLVSEGTEAFVFSLFGLIASALIPLALFMKRALGGGDVKLFAALGALLGATAGLEVLFFSFFAALVWALLEFTWHSRWSSVLRAALSLGRPAADTDRMTAARPPVRMGPAIFMGTCLSSFGPAFL